MLVGPGRELKRESTEWYVFTKDQLEHYVEGSRREMVGILEITYDCQICVAVDLPKKKLEKLVNTVPLGLLTNDRQIKAKLFSDTIVAFKREVLESKEYRDMSAGFQSILALREVPYTAEIENEFSKLEDELTTRLAELETRLQLSLSAPSQSEQNNKFKLYDGLFDVKFQIHPIRISPDKQKERDDAWCRIEKKKKEMRDEEQRLHQNTIETIHAITGFYAATGAKPEGIHTIINAARERPSFSDRPPSVSLRGQNANVTLLQDNNQQLLGSQNNHATRALLMHQPLTQKLQKRLDAGETPIHAIQQLLPNIRIKGSPSQLDRYLQDEEKLQMFENWRDSKGEQLADLLKEDKIRVANKILIAFISDLEGENFCVEALDDGA